MNLTDVCIRRPVVAWMLMLGVVMLGVHGLMRIGISQNPDVDIPVVTVLVGWNGAAPEVVENDVVEVLEESLAQVQGVTGITASARQGSAQVVLEFDIGRDIDAAVQDVQAKLGPAQLRLPKDIDPPVVQKINLDEFPIMWISLSGALPRQQLADTMRYQVQERLRRVSGVGDFQVGGQLERNVRVWFDQARLEARDLTLVEAVAALRRNHLELPAGRLDNGVRELNVRVLGEAKSLDELRSLPVGGTAQSPVRLGEVALVENGFADARSYGRNNGVDAEAIGIKKQHGENVVALATRLRAEMEAIRTTLPPGMTLAINYDAAIFVERMVREVEFELLLAVALTSLVCLLFLGSWSATVNVLLAIPMSILGTVAALQWLGMTLNSFSLLALALVVGLVVDDAIMVQENIERHRAMGLSAPESARRGTYQIAFAALASTVAVVAIFLPVAFMGGIIGKFLMQFGLTLCLAVALSYLEAVTLAPSRCAQFLAAAPEPSRFQRGAESFFATLARRYRLLLRPCLRRPWLTLGAAALVFALCALAAIPMAKELTPSQDVGSLLIRIETTTTASIDETNRVFHRAEEYLSRLPEVENAFSVVGSFGGTGVNAGVVFVTMVPKRQRRRGHLEVMEVIRTDLNRMAGCTATVQDLSKGGFAPGRSYDIDLSLRGDDWAQLVAESQRLRQRLEDSGLAVDVDTDYQLGKPELGVEPDRDRCNDLGVSADDVATALNAMLSSLKIGKFTLDGRRLDLRANLLLENRLRPEDLAEVRLRTGSGALVPLKELVRTSERGVLQAIVRKDNTRAISVFANPAPGHGQHEVMTHINEVLARELPAGVRMVPQGISKQMKETMRDFTVVWVMGIVVAFMVLAMQFDSLLHPITVMTIMPLAVGGALVALWAGGFSLNIYSGIGILLLMGLVKKNSIILVDYANQARTKGLDAVAAMVEAGGIRLRPILMTSVATMAAAVPVAAGLGAGSEVRQPMAVAILGGVALSTLLSLVVVPAFYVVVDRLWMRARGWFRRPLPG
jgi:hydrophobe/amphiphile efflux-1 (HAE1) family protein